jgi:hypothetical protein
MPPTGGYSPNSKISSQSECIIIYYILLAPLCCMNWLFHHPGEVRINNGSFMINTISDCLQSKMTIHSCQQSSPSQASKASQLSIIKDKKKESTMATPHHTTPFNE